MCAEKLTIYSDSAHYEPNKKRGSINIRVCPKPHQEFRILNEYDLLYEIYIEDANTVIHHTIILLDGSHYAFSASPPYKAEYSIEGHGLFIPHNDVRGNLIVKIIKNIYKLH